MEIEEKVFRYRRGACEMYKKKRDEERRKRRELTNDSSEAAAWHASSRSLRQESTFHPQLENGKTEKELESSIRTKTMAGKKCAKSASL